MSSVTAARLKPRTVFETRVRNRSSREGAKPTIIPLHTTEGSNHPGDVDLHGIEALFDRSSSEASSTVVNDGDGLSARLLLDEDKPWTQASYNRFALSIEQIGFASTSRSDWYEKYSRQLASTAKWIAYWSELHGIPIRRGVAIGGRVQRSGVVSHKQLGILGGGHWDPGPAYPMRYVLTLATYFKLKEKRPHSDEFEKARRRANRIRRRWDLPELG